MLFTNTIRLFWWNERKMQGKAKENYGDLLGRYLIEKISNKNIVWSKPSKFSFYNFVSPIYVTIGSILTHVNKYCIVWGSGIISRQYPIKKARFLAVRGPRTRNHLLTQGYNVPEIYGDPAILLPRYYNPKVKKEYSLGIIPHYTDFDKISNLYSEEKSILLIDLMTNDIEKTTNEFLKCEKIISSSLHGIIVAHAYGVPAIWQKFSDDVFGDDVKYQDYFESVNIEPYQLKIINHKMSVEELENTFKGIETLPEENTINNLCDGLMSVCPFKA